LVSIPLRGTVLATILFWVTILTVLLFPSPLGEKPFQTPPLRSLTQQGFQRPNRRTYFLQRKIILIQQILEAESQSGQGIDAYRRNNAVFKVLAKCVDGNRQTLHRQQFSPHLPPLPANFKDRNIAHQQLLGDHQPVVFTSIDH
jgi:hypothetical protein